MAGIGLNAAKITFQQDIEKALEDAFKATFITGAAGYGEEIAKKFAAKGAPAIADAIYKYITQAQITGVINGVVTGTCAASVVSGTDIDILTGTELTIK